MISIVVPLYNKEAYITEAIESILAQTFDRFEIVIVNDGSTDNSLGIAQSINDPRIKIINQRNAGVSSARNNGIKNAKFEYIAFLDADDWWDPSFLEKIFQAIVRFPNHNIFATGYNRVFENKIDTYDHSDLPKLNNVGLINYFKIIGSCDSAPLNSSNIVIKKNHFYERGLFKEDLKNHEDHELFLRLCLNQKIVFINQSLSFYRKTEKLTASSLIYSANNFILYTKTIKYVNIQLNEEDKASFKSFINKFILLSFIKNYRYYSKEQITDVCRVVKNLVGNKEMLIIKALKLIPYKNTYPFFKFFKK